MADKSAFELSDKSIEMLTDTLLATNAMTLTIRALVGRYKLLPESGNNDAVVRAELYDKLLVIEKAIDEATNAAKVTLQMSLKNPPGASTKTH